MQQKVSDYYQNKIQELNSELKKIRKIISFLYLIRLFTFLSFITLLLVFFFKYSSFFILSFSLASLILFLFTVKYELTLIHKEKFWANKLKINENELKYLAYQYHEFDSGLAYTYLNPHLAADFDLFGNGSLFQYLNRCSTHIGRLLFAQGLCLSQRNNELIINKQLAIEELTEKVDFFQHFQAHGISLSENGTELSSLQSWLNEPAEKLQALHFLAILIPLFNITWYSLVALGFFSLNSLLFPIAISLFYIQLNGKKINSAHSKLGKTAKTFEKYTALFQLIEEEDVKTPFLSSLKQQIASHTSKASTQLASLFKLLNSFDIRYNVVASFVLNAVLLFDIQIYIRLAKWKAKNKNSIADWFDSLAEMDGLISYATYAFNNQAYVNYPQLSNEAFALQATDMGHPLLAPSVRINNSIQFGGTPSVMIVTGANMAGKSTFLRTISVNLILAMNGAPVCAKHFLCSPCDIMSSIKIQDSLSNNESYFYAELLRLKDILDHVKHQPKTLVVLDEILRGTNTKDKQLGSLGLLEKLISLNAVVIVATHDLVIGELEYKYPASVTNHCFEVELTNDQLIFDYKLKRGISQKLNASFLMKKMQLID